MALSKKRMGEIAIAIIMVETLQDFKKEDKLKKELKKKGVKWSEFSEFMSHLCIKASKVFKKKKKKSSKKKH